VRANERLSRELVSLAPGSEPDDALDRTGAAAAATRRARAAAPDAPAAERTLRAQAAYLGNVRAVLKLRADGDRLDALGARLASRLERVVPGSATSVVGADELVAWASAELVPAPAIPAAVPGAVPASAPASAAPSAADPEEPSFEAPSADGAEEAGSTAPTADAAPPDAARPEAATEPVAAPRLAPRLRRELRAARRAAWDSHAE
jgi:hypothetical protein